MKFFFDNCISPRYAEAIAILEDTRGYTIVHLRDFFEQGTLDPEWISELGKDGDWIIVSGDPRISRNPIERQAWHESGCTAFFMASGWTSLRFWKQVAHLVNWWPQIAEEARTAKPGTGFEVPLRGRRLKTIYDP